MESELEARDDTEIPTAATERPEQVGVLGRAGAHHLTSRGHDLRGLEVVDGHTVFAAEPAESAAEGQSRDARGGVDAERCGEAMSLGGGVEVRERGASLDGNAACVSVDLCGLHPREVNDDTVVAHSIA